MPGRTGAVAAATPDRVAPITLGLAMLVAVMILAGCGSSRLASAMPGSATGTVAGRSGPQLDGGPQLSEAGGKFAGYVYEGDITSVGGRWQVPGVAANSRLGKASTWIGAQAPGGAAAPFIQIGTQEEMRAATGGGRPPRRFYEAFFSDAQRSFHPYALFSVRPGDQIVADMRLAEGRWMLEIWDQTSGASDEFSTREETRGMFNYALWLQEDVTNTAKNTAFPYPDVAPVSMSSLTVNAITPTSGDLLSTWMALPGGYMGPTPLRRGSFSITAQRLSPAGARYLAIATSYDSRAAAFEAQVEKWKPTTPRSVVRRQTDGFATELSRNVARLRAATWPGSVRQLIGRVEATDLSAARRLRAAAGGGPIAGFEAYRAAQAHFSVNQATVRLIRRRLNVQQLGY